MGHDDWAETLRRQAGMASRRQLADAGVGEAAVLGRTRRGEWQRVFPGVYATFSGPVSWRGRAHAGLLYAGQGAALGYEAAAFLLELQDSPPRVLDVWIPDTRRVLAQPLLQVHRRAVISAHGLPRRTGLELTVLDVASRATCPDDVVGIVTAGARRGTDPAFLQSLLDARGRQRWRGLLTDLFTETDEGVESPLEYRFRRDVQRRHGLPEATLQYRQLLGFGEIRADVRYGKYRTRVELDGRLSHRDKLDSDVWRDNEVGLRCGDLTLRYRWFHVACRPCDTARQVWTALRNRGWSGTPRPCGPTCSLN